MLVTIGTVVMAALLLMGGIAGTIAWFYRRGKDEQSLSDSVKQQAVATNRNTAATELLAAQVGGLRDTLESHGNTLVEHHWRLKALEESPK